MKATTGYIGVFMTGLALVGLANLSLAAQDPDSVRNLPGSLSKESGNTDISGPVLAQDSTPQSRPDFTGIWSLNPDVSDNPRERLKEAMQARRRSKGGGHGMGGSMGRGGGMGRGMGGGGRKSPDRMGGRGMQPSADSLSLISADEQIDILHEEPMLLITDENDQRQRFFTDLRGSSVSASGGFQQRVSVAGWEGETLVVETILNSGARLTRSYQFDTETDQLVIASLANLPEGQSVSYRLVYDRTKSGQDPGAGEQ